jgi:hypothetical protein
MKTTIEVSEIQNLISEFQAQAQKDRDTGNIGHICQALGLEIAIRTLSDLIKDNEK